MEESEVKEAFDKMTTKQQIEFYRTNRGREVGDNLIKSMLQKADNATIAMFETEALFFAAIHLVAIKVYNLVHIDNKSEATAIMEVKEMIEDELNFLKEHGSFTRVVKDKDGGIEHEAHIQE